MSLQSNGYEDLSLVTGQDGSFSVISQNHRSTRRFALWCSSSPSSTNLLHHHALGHWAEWYCFADLLGDASAASAQHTGTKGKVRPFGDSPNGLGDPQAFISLLFSSLFVPFLRRSVHGLFNFKYLKLKDSSCDTPLPKILMLTILASNASSSSTIVFKCPQTKNDSVFTQWFHSLKLWNQMQHSDSQRT
ncbi:hypothetical protein H5410_040869 [Solanum commersonii]|uniref:Uncharacterized protein n=1 Tax=Solanum commersonii TaxID=4109 RepID=A0A9J5XQ07_SOLCO|nr:hypothetical protein H5410_040869 [Solanum commersonii]